MSAPAAYTPNLQDEYAFRRRRAHAQIEAMTGLILQAINYPSRRHREFICALQSVNTGEDARIPYTPFKRAHLTLAEFMQIEGPVETRRKAVYRETVVLRSFQKRTGIMIFHVTPGCEDEATTYIDYLTPIADLAMQRALSSPLWKTDKQAARREAVEWAVSQLPRVEIEPEPERESNPLPLSEYAITQERRLLESIESVAEEIEKRGGDDYEWLQRIAKQLARAAESRKKTARARLDYASLSYIEELEQEQQSRQGGGDKNGGPPAVNPPEDKQLAETVSANMQAEALALAEKGYSVFPLHTPDDHGRCSCRAGMVCRSPGKHPRTPQGIKDATTDVAQIKSWWQKWPEANIGMAMGSISGLVAIDIDPRHGGDASLCELVEQFEDLPGTLRAKTGGGGHHLLYAYPGVTFKNSSSLLGEGIDIKTDGGYIVAAPSLHSSGQRYQWKGNSEVAQLPAWLLLLLTTEKTSAASQPNSSSSSHTAGSFNPDGPMIMEGGRNTRLFKIACALRGNGANESEIFAELCSINERRCVPPLPEIEVQSIAASAAKYAPK
jgi:bifunctional DNA primase/polymerase-like protein/primase-like protein